MTWEGEGRFPNRGVSRTVACNGRTTRDAPTGVGEGTGTEASHDHEGRPYGKKGGGREGRFPNRPYGGLVARSHVTGDHEGRPYGKRGRRGMMLEGRAVPEPPLRGVGHTGMMLEGRAVSEPPLWGVGRTVACNGRPRGTPLRRKGGSGMTWEGEGRFPNRPYELPRMSASTV